MKTLFFDCEMGAAGDMIMAALLNLHPHRDQFIAQLNGILMPNVSVEAFSSVKCGISGLTVCVKIDGKDEMAHDHVHKESSHMSHIENTIKALSIPQNVKKSAIDIFKLIRDAESAVHNVPVHQIHFHEVGSLDAIADIVGVCLLMHELAPESIWCSPINVGSGHVHCAHGILPVPAPATAMLLEGIPFYKSEVNGELCTPTGAAILSYFADNFGRYPIMRTAKIGYGMGKKDFDRVNCIRIFQGETDVPLEEVFELTCSLDDITSESLAFAQETLLSSGALDVYTCPISMKKSRLGFLLTCLCTADTKDNLLSLMFKHTSTLGIREKSLMRHTLEREIRIKQTPHGSIRVKESNGYGTSKSKAEYDDISKLAKETNKSPKDFLDTLELRT